jgi:hypothetical protein
MIQRKIEMLDQEWLVSGTKSWKLFTDVKVKEKLEFKMSRKCRRVVGLVVTIQID